LFFATIFEIRASQPMEGYTELACSDDPTVTYFTKNGAIVARRVITTDVGRKSESWFKGAACNELHSLGGLPAVIRWQNGQLSEEQWHKDGQLHRDNLPAIIWHKLDGEEAGKFWYKNGVMYRPPVVNSVEDELAKIKRRAAKNEAAVTAILAMLPYSK
jgi:hypothetical protein